MIENNLLYSKSSHLNVNLILKKQTFRAMARLVFDQTTGCHSLAKLTQKIYHQTCLEDK